MHSWKNIPTCTNRFKITVNLIDSNFQISVILRLAGSKQPSYRTFLWGRTADVSPMEIIRDRLSFGFDPDWPLRRGDQLEGWCDWMTSLSLLLAIDVGLWDPRGPFRLSYMRKRKLINIPAFLLKLRTCLPTYRSLVLQPHIDHTSVRRCK